MKGILVAALILAAPQLGFATPAMMFNGVNGYIKYAKNIWLVQVKKETGTPDVNACTYYEARVVQTLKGSATKTELTVCSVGHDLIPGTRYIVFGFNEMPSGAWMDNGNISPIPMPRLMSTDELKGKNLKEQLTYIIQARAKEIDAQTAELKNEKDFLLGGLQIDKREDMTQEERQAYMIQEIKKQKASAPNHSVERPAAH